MTAPDAAALERAVRAEDAALVRALLQDATEGERRVLAKALKPLLEGPEWELPKPVVFDSLAGGMAFIFGKMAETMAGVEEEPTAAEQEHSDWWQLRQTPAFAAFAVGVAGGRQAADGALNDCHGRHWHVDDAPPEQQVPRSSRGWTQTMQVGTSIRNWIVRLRYCSQAITQADTSPCG